jgi:vancomycin resistance protein YoaR
VVERNPHYAELPYIRPGFDATVWFGSLDYKFQNDTDAYVLVREYVRPNGYIYAEIWGRPTGKKVTMESEQVASGANSSSWVTYKTVRQNEEVLFDGVLHRDTYQGIVGTNGKTIPPSAVPTAPVDP